MTAVFIGPTDLILEVLCPDKFDKHVQAWRWHSYTTGNYHYWPRYSNRMVYGARAPT